MNGLLIWNLRTSAGRGTLVRALHAKASSRDQLYIGAALPLPASEEKPLDVTSVKMDQETAKKDPFEGLPLQKWADFLGEKFYPAASEMKAEERKRQLAQKNAPVFEPPVIPTFLPVTKWAAQSETVRNTLVVDEASRVRPRLSWYHPDDTMVPRDWFFKGLIEDLKYYRPYMGSKKE